MVKTSLRQRRGRDGLSNFKDSGSATGIIFIGRFADSLGYPQSVRGNTPLEVLNQLQKVALASIVASLDKGGPVL